MTELVRFLKAFKIWVFLEKKMVFFKKELRIFSESPNVAHFCRMHIKWYYFLKMFFHIIYGFYWLKIRKFLKLEKLAKMINEQSILEKKILFKKAFLPKWKAQNMPMVAAILFYTAFSLVSFIVVFTSFNLLGAVQLVDRSINRLCYWTNFHCAYLTSAHHTVWTNDISEEY